MSQQVNQTEVEIHDVRLNVVEVTWRAKWLTLELVDKAGNIGLGECSGSGASDVARELVGSLAERLRGRTIAEVSADNSIVAGLPEPLVNAVDLALSDLKAKATGTALDILPTERYRSRIPLYANINRAERDRTSAKLAALGARAVADGFRAVKLAPFDDTNAEGGLAHLRALRKAIGPDIELMVDAHHKLTIHEQLRILPELEALNVVWLEDPATIHDIDGWKTVAAATKIPLAGGEQAKSLEDVEPLLSSGALSAVLPDARIAGVYGAYEILLRAQELGILCTLHNPLGPITTAASLHIAAAVPNFEILEYAYGEVPWRGEILSPEEKIFDASLPVPNGPGLGVDLSEKARQFA
jgi:galactonate dehydratase